MEGIASRALASRKPFCTVKSVWEGKAPASQKKKKKKDGDKSVRKDTGNQIVSVWGRVSGGHRWAVGRQGLMELGHHWL